MIKKYQDEYKNSGELYIWRSMKNRCAKNYKYSQYYFEKGIFVCEEWANDFFVFIKDMGRRPSKLYSIDRIDNDKGYYKENCRWTTSMVQSRNKSCNKWFIYNGEKKILKDWALELQIPYKRLHLRIKRDGLSFEEAIKEDPFEYLIEIDNEKKRLIDWCRFYNREYKTVLARIHQGWNKVEAIIEPTKNNKNYSLCLKDKEIEKIKTMLLERKSGNFIAKIFNVTPSCISSIKKRLNIKNEIKICKIENCNNKHKALGFCKLHYDRHRKSKIN